MNDLDQYFGADLSASATGDLQPASGTLRSQQRILRRLLTNPGDYIWNPEYGAGLPRRVGDTVDVPAIRALIRGQMMLEESVAATPPPEITVTPIAGGVSCVIRYAEAASNAPVVLSFNVSQ